MTGALREPEVLVDGLDHPEAVAWGPDGHVYAGGEAGQVYRVGLDGTCTQIATTGGFLLGLCLDAAGVVYACDLKARAVLRITQHGVVSLVSRGAAGRPMVNPNWPAFCADGTLLVSDSGTTGQEDGCVFAITPDGHTSVLTTACGAFPNGMALSADGAWLHVAETHAQRVVRVRLHGPARGEVEPVCALPERSLPDGLAVDVQGGLLIACYTPDVIYRWYEGRLSVLAEDWTRHILASPTNVAFCGPGLDTLVIASLARWHLSRLVVEVPGVPLPRPTVSPREEPA